MVENKHVESESVSKRKQLRSLSSKIIIYGRTLSDYSIKGELTISTLAFIVYLILSIMLIAQHHSHTTFEMQYFILTFSFRVVSQSSYCGTFHHRFLEANGRLFACED